MNSVPKVAQIVCEKIVGEMRKRSRPVTRGDLMRVFSETEARLVDALHYGVKNGILIREGNGSSSRYKLASKLGEAKNVESV